MSPQGSFSASQVCAGEPPSPEASINEAIDYYVSTKLKSEGIEPASSISESLFLRRLSLDLTGRIPTEQEHTDYLALPEETRRSEAIDRLINSADFAFHQANEIDLMLLARIRKDNDWRKFLLKAAQENLGWDDLFRQVMTPEVEHPESLGPAAFLRERVRELDDLTNDTAVLFFGVNISCAKCHDHPLVADWEQDHYYGMASFFKRTYQTKSRMLAEDFQGRVKFTNILGEEKQASFMFLSNTSIEEPEKELNDESKKTLEEAIKNAKKDEKANAPNVEFSPRAEFVRLALADEDRDFFARNIVNRVWARLLGRGLVMPLDQLHSDNPASHPELFDWLVQDLKSHDYDLKRLISGIVNSEVYARSCRWDSSSEMPPPDMFAVGTVRPLNPRQLSLSLIIATTNSSSLPGFTKPQDWNKRREDLENRSNGFADLFPIPDENFQVGTDEALLVSNSNRFENDFLRSSDDRLIGQLKKLDSQTEKIQSLFRIIFSRDPETSEMKLAEDFLNQHSENPETGLQQLTWAMLASPEFRFNH